MDVCKYRYYSKTLKGILPVQWRKAERCRRFRQRLFVFCVLEPKVRDLPVSCHNIDLYNNAKADLLLNQ